MVGKRSPLTPFKRAKKETKISGEEAIIFRKREARKNNNFLNVFLCKGI
jgi:hypothetical protein